MARGRKSPLEAALDEAERIRPGNLPKALPVGHTGIAGDLAVILSKGRLEPKYCGTMRKRTLYLFYGGLFYRSETTPKSEEAAYPSHKSSSVRGRVEYRCVSMLDRRWSESALSSMMNRRRSGMGLGLMAASESGVPARYRPLVLKRCLTRSRGASDGFLAAARVENLTHMDFL